jgi:hypothetical protein
VYYGGLIHARVRQFDADRRRPGLPPGVAALVTDLDPTTVELLNLGSEERAVVLQGGAYGEHDVTAAATARPAGERESVDGAHVRVDLPAGTRTTVSLWLDRFARDPTYAFPWDRAD